MRSEGLLKRSFGYRTAWNCRGNVSRHWWEWWYRCIAGVVGGGGAASGGAGIGGGGGGGGGSAGSAGSAGTAVIPSPPCTCHFRLTFFVWWRRMRTAFVSINSVTHVIQIFTEAPILIIFPIFLWIFSVLSRCHRCTATCPCGRGCWEGNGSVGMFWCWKIAKLRI